MPPLPHAQPLVSIPRVGDFALGDWEATTRVMKHGARFWLRQSWFEKPSPGFRPGYVRMGVNGGDLVAYAVLRDDQPHNRAVEWNDRTWITGDVLELFFQAEGKAGYHEFHVTPENQRLQLVFPFHDAFRQKHPWGFWTIKESCFESAASINAARTHWQAVMRIPLAMVLGGTGEGPGVPGSRKFRFTFSRYDYLPGQKLPVTSATAPLTASDFHNTYEWSWAEAAL